MGRLCGRSLGPEDILDLGHQISGKSAILGMAVDCLGVVGFMDAVEFVTSRIGPMPSVLLSKSKVNPITTTEASTPINNPTCCFTGVAPTI